MSAGLPIFPMSGHGVITFSACARDVTAEFVDDPIYSPDSSRIADLYPQWVLPGSSDRGSCAVKAWSFAP